MAGARGLADEFEVDSAGTYAGHAGCGPDRRMLEAAYARGYLLTHRARQVREEDFERFDMLIAMDDSNYHNLFRLAPSPEAREKIFRMSEFFTAHSDRTYVPDPYYEGHEGFELVLDMLEEGCAELLRRTAEAMCN